MISVWPKFYTDHRELPGAAGEGLPLPRDARSGRPRTGSATSTRFYDAFNPEARQALLGADERRRSSARASTPGGWTRPSPSWWARARRARSRRRCTRRRSARARAWPTPTCCRAARRSTRASARADPDKRVFILTRSAFAGQPALRRRDLVGRRLVGLGQPAQADPGRAQHVALRHPVVDDRHRRLRGAAASGRGRTRSPRTSRSGASSSTRWFQFATFCPLLARARAVPVPRDVVLRRRRGPPRLQDAARVRPAALPDAALHATRSPRRVTHRDAALMRPLVMDFRDDPEVLDIGDQFLFGPVAAREPGDDAGRDARAPSTCRGGTRRRGARDRRGWYDFWTGAHQAGRPALRRARALRVAAGLRAGRARSCRWAPSCSTPARSPADPLTLWVYTGADARASSSTRTTASSYGYEKGAFATIPLALGRGEAARSRSARAQGTFPGHAREARAAGRVRLAGRAVPHSRGAARRAHARLRRSGRIPVARP